MMSKAVQVLWGVVTYGPFVVLAIAVVIFVMLFRTSGDGFYRYPCQDPEMWSQPQCQPPACEATGTCTDYLIERGGPNEG